MKYSILSAIKNDMLLYFELIGSIIFAMFGATSYIFGYSLGNRNRLVVQYNKDLVIFGVLCIVISILLLILIFWRINLINLYILKGQVIIGKISKIVHFKDRGYIYYNYKIREINYKGRVFIHKTKETIKYAKDDEVTLLIKPKNNHRSIIKDLYK